MAVISMKQLLESGAHFGHLTRRWNPKMKKYIFSSRNNIYIIDLQKTVKYVETAYKFIEEIAMNGGKVLFIGTKRQAQDPIKHVAEKTDMPYVNQRWLGGMLTNYATIKKSIQKMNEYKALIEDENNVLVKKERLILKRKVEKLEKNLGGISKLEGLPEAVFIIDPRREKNAVAESKKLGIPIVAVLDTNCDPDPIDYPIPGNDDAIRSVKLFVNLIGEAITKGKEKLDKRLDNELIKKEKKVEVADPNIEGQKQNVADNVSTVKEEESLAILSDKEAVKNIAAAMKQSKVETVKSLSEKKLSETSTKVEPIVEVPVEDPKTVEKADNNTKSENKEETIDEVVKTELSDVDDENEIYDTSELKFENDDDYDLAEDYDEDADNYKIKTKKIKIIDDDE